MPDDVPSVTNNEEDCSTRH